MIMNCSQNLTNKTRADFGLRSLDHMKENHHICPPITQTTCHIFFISRNRSSRPTRRKLTGEGKHVVAGYESQRATRFDTSWGSSAVTGRGGEVDLRDQGRKPGRDFGHRLKTRRRSHIEAPLMC